MNEDEKIAACRNGLNQIYEVLRTSPLRSRNHIELGRSIIALLDSTTFMTRCSAAREQVRIINALQQLAYVDADNDVVADIAAWCSRQWLSVLERDPQNVAALRGVGQCWLSRAQGSLARIHRRDGSSSSSGGSSQQSVLSLSPETRDRLSVSSREEAEARAGTQDYVEARQFLQPATEYLDRAIGAAVAQDVLTGDLLALTGEAYMSIGNTSSPHLNEQYFHRAIRLLRDASAIPGYALDSYLQRYVDDFGRLID